MALEPVNRTVTGRPKKDITSPTFQDAFLEYLREGMSFKEASALVGASPQTLRKYVREGMQDVEGGRDTAIGEFAVEVNKAMAEAKHLRVQALNNASANPAFWAAAAWWLERRYPQEFGRQDRVNMNMTGQLNVGISQVEITDEEKDAIRSVLGKYGVNAEDNGEGESFGFGSDSETEQFSLS